MQRLHHSFLQLRHTSPLKLFALAAAFILVSASLVFYSTPAGPSGVDLVASLPSSNDTESKGTCYVDLELLRSHGYNSANYARLEIAVTRTENFTGFSDTLPARFPAYQKIRLDTVKPWLPLSPKICSPAVTIQAPLPVAPPNASHILFGVATTLRRLDESLPAFAHWAAGTDARIYAVVDSEVGSEIRRVHQRAKELDIRLTIIQSDDERLDQYFSLLRVLLKHRDASTQWAVLIDDDTFFPSMRNLVNRLAIYDPTKPQYIGALTEDLAQMFSWSYMAYGGAGIFLSMPLLEQLDKDMMIATPSKPQATEELPGVSTPTHPRNSPGTATCISWISAGMLPASTSPVARCRSRSITGNHGSRQIWLGSVRLRPSAATLAYCIVGA